MKEPMSDAVRDRLKANLESATGADKAVANYMLTNLHSLPFENAGTLAEKIGVSEITIGRFCRKLGYKHFKELKTELGETIGNQPWLVGDRLKEFSEQSRQGNSVAKAIEKKISALIQLNDIAQKPGWKRAAKRIASADKVFVVGFQTERGLAQYFANQLQYLRNEVLLLDVSAGNFADVFLTDHRNAALVIFEARKYSNIALLLARRAKAQGIPVTLFTDPYCHWSGGVTSETFNVPTSVGMFWETAEMMAVLGNLLLSEVFNEIGVSVEERMNNISSLYHDFTGHIK